MPIDYQGFPPNEVWQMGLSHVYFYNDAYHLVKVKAAYPKTHKTFDEAKGKVVSDYQNVLEEQWLKELNSRYNIKLNTEVLQKVKAQISISK